MERIGGRGAQSGDGRTLISRRSRHRFRGVIRFTGGFVSKSYFDADRFFAFIGEAARQGGRRSGHIRRDDGTELRLGIFTRFKGRELRDGARITLVADNDIRIKIVFRFGFESVQLISQGEAVEAAFTSVYSSCAPALYPKPASATSPSPSYS